MIEAALRASGLRTGLYTSPHLHSFRERIRIAGIPISADEVARRAAEIRAAVEGERAPALTFFEVTTLLAFEAFRDARCDVVVLEVGLGGRLDATNVIERPEVCAITGIAFDHRAYLGDTLAAIAREKAGILKPGVPAVIGPVDEEAWEAIAAVAGEIGAPLWRFGREVALEDDEGGSFTVRTPTRSVTGLRLSLEGAFQRDNAAVAVAVLTQLDPPIAENAIREALASVVWPGRLERVPGGPEMLLDAAHNPDGCCALARYLASIPRAGRRVLVFGAMADKDWRAMLSFLRPEVDMVIAVSPPLSRAERAETLARAAGGESAASIPEAIERARALAGPEGQVVVAGSIFLLAGARAHLLGLESDPPIPF
jgi:dihydrofolate synthase/folylpolyglutamate synthase